MQGGGVGATKNTTVTFGTVAFEDLTGAIIGETLVQIGAQASD